MHKLVKNRILITMILLVTMLLSLVPVVTSAEGNEGDLAQEGPKTEVQNLEDANPENPNPENADPEDANLEDANPENPNPENADPEDAYLEDANPENPNPENADPEDANQEDANPENPNPENADPEDANPEDANPENPNPENVDSEAPNQEDNSDTNEELQPFMAPLRGPMSGGSYTLGNGDVFGSLKEAMEAAPDGDTITVTGELTETQAISVNKNITLMAGDKSAKINFTGNGVLYVDSGNTLTLGSGEAEPVLTLSSAQYQLVVVSQGNLLLQGGASLESPRNTITLQSVGAKASISGGSVTSSGQVAIKMQDGAIIDSISDGIIKGKMSAIDAEGTNTTIKNISGGSFENENNENTMGIGSCVMLSRGATIGSIEAGLQGEPSFTAKNGSALLIRDGGSVGTISGGQFSSSVNHSYDSFYGPISQWHYNSAISLVARNNIAPTKIGQITGGSFQGLHAIYMAAFADLGENSPTIDEISGGTFINQKQSESRLRATILVGQRSLIKKISGGTFTSLDDDRVLHVEVQYENIGVQPDRLSEITEISGGTFTQQRGAYGEKHATVEVNIGRIGTISGGIFNSIQETIQLRQGGSLGTITGGIFNNEQTHDKDNLAWQDRNMGSIMHEVSKKTKTPVNIEPALSTSQADKGTGRYRSQKPYSEGNTWYHNYRVFHDDEGEQTWYLFPTYTGADGHTHNYILGQYDYDYDHEYQTENIFAEFKDEHTKGKTDYKYKEKIRFSTNDKYLAFESAFDPRYPLSIEFENDAHDLYGLAPYYSDEYLIAWLDASGQECSSDTQGALPYRYLVKRPTLCYDKNLVDAEGELPGPQVMRPYQTRLVIRIESVREPEDCIFTVKKDLIKSPTHKFKGWNTKQDGTGVWIREEEWYAMPFYDVTLYAQWEPAGVKITYDPNGGVFRGSAGLTSEAHLIGEEIKIAEAATRSGYKFLYWEGSKYFPGDTYEVVGDHTFTAVWEKETPGLRPSGIRVTNPSNQYFVTISEAPTQKRITNLPATGSHDSYLSALGLLAIGLILILKKR